MFNPFAKFEERFIDAFKKAKKYYLVSQTFTREKNLLSDESKSYIMLTHYSDKGLAQIHLSAVAKDKFSSLINLESEKHVEKLRSMLLPDSKYIVYSSLITDPKIVEQTLDKNLKHNVMRYIQRHTNWSIGKDKTIYPKTELIFGELFIQLRYGSQTIKVPLNEIENA